MGKDYIQTPLTDMLGIQYPIICAPMFLVSYEELVISVSNAGGLGTFPLPNYRTLNDLTEALKTIRRSTDRPIGVNIHLSGKFPWKEQLALCLDAGVNFFITSLGDPSLIISDVHQNGGRVFADVISLKHALRAQDKGVDGLIAVASDAGGHGGLTPTIVLVPYLKANTELPILAAGGISTGAQLASALALGACGVISGTRFIATKEARVVPEYKQAVIESGPEDIVSSDSITGNRANWISKSIENISSGLSPESKGWKNVWSAGKSVAQVEEILPAGDIIKAMVRDYFKTVHDLNKSVVIH